MTKTTVYVWLPSNWESVSSWIKDRYAGHAAIDIPGCGYISFYPGKSPIPFLPFFKGPSDSRYQSYADEAREKGKAEVIEIEGLNIQLMRRQWKLFLERKRYSLLRLNCSGVVLEILERGIWGSEWDKFSLYGQIQNISDLEMKKRFADAAKRKKYFFAISSSYTTFLWQPSDVYVMATCLQRYSLENIKSTKLETQKPQGMSDFFEQVFSYFDPSKWEVVIEQTGQEISEKIRKIAESAKDNIQQLVGSTGEILYASLAFMFFGLWISSVVFIAYFVVIGIITSF